MQGVDVSSVPGKSVVPLTVGMTRDTKTQESCLVMVFYSNKQEEIARDALTIVRDEYPGMNIVRTSRISIRQADAERVFVHWSKQVTAGEVLALQLSGLASREAGGKIAVKHRGAVGASKDAEQAEKDIQGFFGLAEMHQGF